MTTLDLITRDDLQQFKTELFAELKRMHIAGTDPNPKKKWLRSAEVRKMLNVSPGTLQNLRTSGQLRFSKVGSMTYYKVDDIEKMLNSSFSV